MEPETAQRLIELNHQFYQTFAVQFSDTRQRLQTGVLKALESEVPLQASLLDLGCGNGELAAVLARRGQSAPYVGVDFSSGLLAEAAASLQDAQSAGAPAAGFEAVFLPRDLTAPGWEKDLPHAPFERATAFAVLHHLPGRALHLSFLQAAERCLRPGGRLVLSVWQFLNSPRTAGRVQPWEAAGLSTEQVDTGDYLLDWRSGGQGLRYVHLFSEPELESLAHESGFGVRGTYYSDGSGGRLGLYQVWETLRNSE